MTQPELIDVEIEIDDEDLEYLHKNNIDINEFFNKSIKELRSDTPLGKLKREALKLEQSIRDDTERLKQITEEIRKLDKKLYYCKEHNVICRMGCDKGIKILQAISKADTYDEMTGVIAATTHYIVMEDGSEEQVKPFKFIGKCDFKEKQ